MKEQLLKQYYMEDIFLDDTGIAGMSLFVPDPVLRDSHDAQPADTDIEDIRLSCRTALFIDTNVAGADIASPEAYAETGELPSAAIAAGQYVRLDELDSIIDAMVEKKFNSLLEKHGFTLTDEGVSINSAVTASIEAVVESAIGKAVEKAMESAMSKVVAASAKAANDAVSTSLGAFAAQIPTILQQVETPIATPFAEPTPETPVAVSETVVEIAETDSVSEAQLQETPIVAVPIPEVTIEEPVEEEPVAIATEPITEEPIIDETPVALAETPANEPITETPIVHETPVQPVQSVTLGVANAERVAEATRAATIQEPIQAPHTIADTITEDLITSTLPKVLQGKLTGPLTGPERHLPPTIADTIETEPETVVWPMKKPVPPEVQEVEETGEEQIEVISAQAAEPTQPETAESIPAKTAVSAETIHVAKPVTARPEEIPYEETASGHFAASIASAASSVGTAALEPGINRVFLLVAILVLIAVVSGILGNSGLIDWTGYSNIVQSLFGNTFGG